MKRYTTKILCKGCQNEQELSFDAHPSFTFFLIGTECTKCESDLGVEVKPGFFKKQVKVKVKMLQHSKKLLKILDERAKHAKNHA